MGKTKKDKVKGKQAKTKKDTAEKPTKAGTTVREKHPGAKEKRGGIGNKKRLDARSKDLRKDDDAVGKKRIIRLSDVHKKARTPSKKEIEEEENEEKEIVNI